MSTCIHLEARRIKEADFLMLGLIHYGNVQEAVHLYSIICTVSKVAAQQQTQTKILKKSSDYISA